MIDEPQGADAPENVTDPAPPVVEGAAAWAASLQALAPGMPDGDATAWVTNCLHDGYAQGAAASAKAPVKTESVFARLEDEAIRAAEEAAYAVSNLIAPEHNRKPDDGIDAWRQRTGGLQRHPGAQEKAGA